MAATESTMLALGTPAPEFQLPDVSFVGETDGHGWAETTKELRRQLAEMTAERDGLDKILKGDALIESMTYAPGCPLELHLSHPMQASMIAGFADMLKQSKAENYIEMKMSDKNGNDYTCTIQRAEKPTSHELRRKAEQELAAVKAELNAFTQGGVT